MLTWKGLRDTGDLHWGLDQCLFESSSFVPQTVMDHRSGDVIDVGISTITHFDLQLQNSGLSKQFIRQLKLSSKVLHPVEKEADRDVDHVMGVCVSQAFSEMIR